MRAQQIQNRTKKDYKSAGRDWRSHAYPNLHPKPHPNPNPNSNPNPNPNPNLTARARPKSQIFTSQFEFTRIFPGCGLKLR